MIFPQRVFGSIRTRWTSSGRAIFPIRSTTRSATARANAASTYWPRFTTTNATGTSPFTASSRPQTAASATPG